MILARLSVFGAILCTLWFNGSYAYAKAAGEAHQFAMVAVALSIDLFKCAALPAAAVLDAQGLRLRAIVLVLLWPLAFGWSLFSGYSSLTTNRTEANVAQDGQAQQRVRAQTDYDLASAALIIAKRSPLWDATAACTLPKTNPHKQFCDGIARTTTQQVSAASILNAGKPVHTDPEVTALASVTAIPRAWLLFAIAFAPALILELLSSFGAYAISSAAKPPGTPAAARWRAWLPNPRPTPQNAPTPAPAASAVSSAPPVTWTIKR